MYPIRTYSRRIAIIKEPRLAGDKKPIDAKINVTTAMPRS